MFGFSFGELLVILIIVVLVFGVGRLPELGTALGEGIKNFKKGYREAKSIDISPHASEHTAEMRPGSNAQEQSGIQGDGNMRKDTAQTPPPKNVS